MSPLSPADRLVPPALTLAPAPASGRFLGLNCLTASQRAQVSAVKILGRRLSSLSPAGSPLRRQPKPSVAVVADDRRVDVLVTASGTDRLLPAHETSI